MTIVPLINLIHIFINPILVSFLLNVLQNVLNSIKEAALHEGLEPELLFGEESPTNGAI